MFEALFDNYLVRSNPVSKALQGMVNLLEEQALEKDTLVLSRFYESVKMRVSGIDNAEGRQRIIIELYDKFFRTAFPDSGKVGHRVYAGGSRGFHQPLRGRCTASHVRTFAVG